MNLRCWSSALTERRPERTRLLLTRDIYQHATFTKNILYIPTLCMHAFLLQRHLQSAFLLNDKRFCRLDEAAMTRYPSTPFDSGLAWFEREFNLLSVTHLIHKWLSNLFAPIEPPQVPTGSCTHTFDWHQPTRYYSTAVKYMFDVNVTKELKIFIYSKSEWSFTIESDRIQHRL